MRHFLALSSTELTGQRPAGNDEDVHFSQALVEAIVTDYTVPGGLMLDPFAGFGTTLVVSERMGRRAVGIELLPERVRFARRRLSSGSRLIEGDARRLAAYGIGPVDLCLTSPPYMNAFDHPQNPLTAYRTLDGDYRGYLAQLGEVFAAVGGLLRPGGHLVVNAANLVTGGLVTPLAWDIAHAVGEHLSFRGEIYLHWDPPLPGITGDYCLVFGRGVRPGNSGIVDNHGNSRQPRL